MRSTKKFDRRSVLRGAGGVALGLPFLEIAAPRAYAQGSAPKRLVIFIHGQGTMLSRWKPSATGENFTLPQMLSPLQPHRAKINVWSDIDNRVRDQMRSNGHNAAGRSLLNAHVFSDPNNQGSAGAGPSIDQVIAQRLAQSQRMPMPSLELMVGGGVGEYQMIFSAPGVRVTGINDPRSAWTRITRGMPGGQPAPAPRQPTAAELMLAQRQSVLDAVKDDYRRVRTTLGAADRERLDAHLARVEEMERGLQPLMPQAPGAPAPARPAACEARPLGLPASGYNPADGNVEHISCDKQIDNAVLALACRVTPVVTIQLTNYHGPTFPWLNLRMGGNWHDRVHNRGGDNVEGMARAFQWYGEMFAQLLQRMNAVDEGNGTLLDNSLVLWVSEFGDGAAHYTSKLPVVLAGSLGGRLRTGRHLSFPGRVHNDLYVTILNLFGFDDRSFGLPGMSRGPLPIA